MSANQNKNVREILETPFGPEQIKTRPGNFGQELAYVEGHTVIKRLNEAFEGAWSFEVVEHRFIHPKQATFLQKQHLSGKVRHLLLQCEFP